MSPRSTIERKKAVERARGALHNANTGIGANVSLNAGSVALICAGTSARSGSASRQVWRVARTPALAELIWSSARNADCSDVVIVPT